MPDTANPLLDLATQFRTALLRREHAAERQMVAAYADAWRAIRDELGRLTVQIAEARAQGRTIGQEWLYQEQRLQRLQTEITNRLAVFNSVADSYITAAQREAIQLALVQSQALMGAALGTPPPGVALSFARVPEQALVSLVGVLQNGVPLRALLQATAGAAVEDAARILTTGLALGHGPRQIAKDLRNVMGGNLTQALRIARTETLRAYRTAALETYKHNSDVLTSWRWTASLTTRTCAVCWAMHGRIFPLSTPFVSHPVCRCAPTPVSKTWEELGFPGIPDTRPVVRPGAEVFKELSEDDQRAILGPGKLALYQQGMPLSAVVGERRDPVWGASRVERPLKELVG